MKSLRIIWYRNLSYNNSILNVFMLGIHNSNVANIACGVQFLKSIYTINFSNIDNIVIIRNGFGNLPDLYLFINSETSLNILSTSLLSISLIGLSLVDSSSTYSFEIGFWWDSSSSSFSRSRLTNLEISSSSSLS